MLEIKHLLLFLLVSCFLFAKEVVLFPGGRQAPNYNELASNLQAGDVLVFQSGRRFVFNQYLGKGKTTRVLDVKAESSPSYLSYPESFALRIPLAYPDHRFQYPAYIDSWVKGHEKLKATAAPIPDVYDHLPGQFVAVEKLDLKFTLLDLLTVNELVPVQHRSSFRAVPSEYRSEATLALKDVARDMAMTGAVGDFHYGQVAYDVTKRKWYLVDWIDFDATSRSMAAHPFGNYRRNDFLMAFPRPYSIPEAPKLLRELEAVVRAVRGEPTFFQKCHAALRMLGWGN